MFGSKCALALVVILLTVLLTDCTAWVVPRFDGFGDTGVPQTPFELDDFLNGAYYAKSWNGTWVSGNFSFWWCFF